MRRGDLYLANLDPSIGAEANKTRPVVIVSRNDMNQATLRLGRGVVTVAPITSSVTKVYDFQVRIPSGESGLRNESKIQAEQVRSIDIARLGRHLGALAAIRRDDLDRALRLHLDL